MIDHFERIKMMALKRRYSSYDFMYYPPSTPREAKGGIKTQSKRGAFGTSWWAKRWIEVLESFNIGARLGRGRSYARKGQVLSIDIGKGNIKATVQGSRSTPYSVKAGVKMLSKSDWKKVIRALSEQPLYTAKLLAGEMPQDIGTVFDKVGLSLFPKKYNDLTTNCSCPDWSNPCKHIAAVFYLLGEEFDRDPFLIFKMRGMTREELIDHLPQMATTEGTPETLEHTENPPVPEPLETDGTLYWQGTGTPEDLLGGVEIPQIHAALPKRLGHFSFWRGKDRFLDTLESIYAPAAQQGLEIFIGEMTKHTKD
jgi:uncharacterized Zn finger protein